MPRRFIFKLQPVLEQRERAERDQQVKVAAVERRRVELEDRLRDLDRQMQEERRQLRDHLGAALIQPGGSGGEARAQPVRVPLDAVRMQTNAGLHHALTARRLALELAGVQASLARERQTLIRASAARKAVELLKQKRRADFDRDLLRRELADLDELTVMRHARANDPTETDA